MREVKFRFWNEYDSRMIDFDFDDVYGGKIEHAHLNFILYKGKVMQFTGVKDKNGVDIYEGDVVEWNNCNWKIRYMLDSDLTSAGYYCESANGNTFYCFSKTMRPSRVIGNIHQNPELITGA